MHLHMNSISVFPPYLFRAKSITRTLQLQPRTYIRVTLPYIHTYLLTCSLPLRLCTYVTSRLLFRSYKVVTKWIKFIFITFHVNYKSSSSMYNGLSGKSCKYDVCTFRCMYVSLLLYTTPCSDCFRLK